MSEIPENEALDMALSEIQRLRDKLFEAQHEIVMLTNMLREARQMDMGHRN